MKFDIFMSVNLEHASPIEKYDTYSATVRITESDFGVCKDESDCEVYRDRDEFSASVNVKENLFELVKMTKITNDGAIYNETWTVDSYVRSTNERNFVSFDANNLDDEMMNISFITGLSVKDINRIFKALKKMRDEFKFRYTISDTDLETN